MRRFVVTLILLAIVAVGGCAGMTETPQRTLSGGAAGVAGGALIGAIAGDATLGAAIGGGVGLLGGYVYNQHEEAKKDPYQRGCGGRLPSRSAAQQQVTPSP